MVRGLEEIKKQNEDASKTQMSCGNCFFRRGEECRRNPPKEQDGTWRAIWPLVKIGHWCGEWKSQ